MRNLLTLGILTILSTAAYATDAAPGLDLNRSVTLTGQELQLYVKAELAAHEAQRATAAAQPVLEKIGKALTPEQPTK